MNIACDARSLVGRHTGVATWVIQIMGGLVRDHGHSVILAASKPVALPDELRLEGVTNLRPTTPWLPGTIWLHTRLPGWLTEHRPDVFVGSLGVLPRRCPVPTVAVVHDLTPRTHPHHHTLTNRFCFNAYLEESLEMANAVVAVSTATERVLLDHFPIIASKLVTIRNGVGDFFSPPDPDDDGRTIRQRFSAGRPYVLHLGTIEPRKGVADLVDAWERLHSLRSAPPDLVVAGGLGWDTAPIIARIQESPYRDRIHIPGYVDREAARDLLRHAEVFIIASEAEGFGLPLAEAISCHAPSVASDIPSLRETGGEAALFAPPQDPSALARTLDLALQPATADDLRKRAVLRVPELRWGPAITAWNALLEGVATGRLPTITGGNGE